jgi:hypothetical protein
MTDEKLIKNLEEYYALIRQLNEILDKLENFTFQI